MTHGLGLKKISAVTHIYQLGLNPINSLPMPGELTHLPDKYFPYIERFFRARGG